MLANNNLYIKKYLQYSYNKELSKTCYTKIASPSSLPTTNNLELF